MKSNEFGNDERKEKNEMFIKLRCSSSVAPSPRRTLAADIFSLRSIVRIPNPHIFDPQLTPPWNLLGPDQAFSRYHPRVFSRSAICYANTHLQSCYLVQTTIPGQVDLDFEFYDWSGCGTSRRSSDIEHWDTK